MPPGCQRVLIPADELTARVGELGRQIRGDYAGRTPVLVGVLKGAVVFLADLMRAIDAPCECDFIAVSSYGASTRSSGIVKLTKDLSVPIEGRDVLIVEDIVDTGRTLPTSSRNLETRQPRSLRVCALLDKIERREVPVDPRLRRVHDPRRVRGRLRARLRRALPEPPLPGGLDARRR